MRDLYENANDSNGAEEIIINNVNMNTILSGDFKFKVNYCKH